MAKPEPNGPASMTGQAALPRRNGELVFEAPWESRAFGAAVALADAGVFEWESFRQELIAEIGRWEREHGDDPDAEWNYYERWLAAFERLLSGRKILSETEVDAQAQRVAHAAAHEHDHEH